MAGLRGRQCRMPPRSSMPVEMRDFARQPLPHRWSDHRQSDVSRSGLRLEDAPVRMPVPTHALDVAVDTARRDHDADSLPISKDSPPGSMRRASRRPCPRA